MRGEEYTQCTYRHHKGHLCASEQHQLRIPFHHHLGHEQPRQHLRHKVIVVVLVGLFRVSDIESYNDPIYLQYSYELLIAADLLDMVARNPLERAKAVAALPSCETDFG